MNKVFFEQLISGILLFVLISGCNVSKNNEAKNTNLVKPLPTYNILSGPFIVRPGETKITIRWEFESQANPQMMYSIDSTNVTDTIDLVLRGTSNGGSLYEAKITRLIGGNTYYYRLLAENTNWSKFITYVENQNNISFVAMGDSRSDSDMFSNIMKKTNSKDPDFIISMGDLVETGGEYTEWHEFFFSVAGQYLASIPLISTFGDHEVEGDDGELFRYFLMQDEPTDKLWFSFDYGNAHFISLDYRFQYDGEEMIAWFKKDISDAGKKWNFVFMHRPVYNMGGYRKDWGRKIWSKLFLDYKVDMVFAGHSHLYERFYPARPEVDTKGQAVSYVTTGGAGADLYDKWNNTLVLATTESANHFIDIKIDGDTLKYKAIKANGILLDEFEMTKTNGSYDADFEKTIITQEVLNTISGFASALSDDIEIPTFDAPASFQIYLESFISQDIPYSIVVNNYSDYYGVQEVKGVLSAESGENIVIAVNKKKEFTVDEYGDFNPELRLKIIYELDCKKDSITGRAITN